MNKYEVSFVVEPTGEGWDWSTAVAQHFLEALTTLERVEVLRFSVEELVER